MPQSVVRQQLDNRIGEWHCIVALKDGLKVFEGLPAEIDRAKFKEIYGEEAQEVRATAVEAQA